MIDFKKDLYASYVNMDHRSDRNGHMIGQLSTIGLSAVRQRGMPHHEYTGPREKVWVMEKRTKGAIGCHYSQVAIMEKAFAEGKSAFVMEDDLIFCSDFNDRMEHIQGFLNKQKEWDVVWLGGTCHCNPAQWHTGHNNDLPESGLGYDMELTSDPRIVRTYGAFSTYAYLVNKDSIPKILKMLDENVHLSMGIDWLFIKLQPQLKTFMYVPGCVKQMDSQSDIGGAITIFSNFGVSLNGNAEKSAYWWKDKKEDFNPETFNWAEAKTAYENNPKLEEVTNIVDPSSFKKMMGIDDEGIEGMALIEEEAIPEQLPLDDSVSTSSNSVDVQNYFSKAQKYYRIVLESKTIKLNRIDDNSIPTVDWGWQGSDIAFAINPDQYINELNISHKGNSSHHTDPRKKFRPSIIHEISKDDFEQKRLYSIPLNQYVYHV